MLRVGTARVNRFGEGDVSTPLGGWKQPGFGGRGNALRAHDQHARVEAIRVDLSEDAGEAVA